MRKPYQWILLAGCICIFAACRTQQTGCRIPKRNMGAEKVVDEMNKPKKGGLFKRNE